MTHRYEITIGGRLPERWQDWLESIQTVYSAERQQTTIVIDVPDQTSVHGVLERIRDLHLILIALKLISPEPQEPQDGAQPPSL